MSQSPHHIICIDDSLADITLLRLAFDRLEEPYVLEVLPDGEAAIAYLRKYCGRDTSKPCLIIIDLHLPKYDGIAVLKSINAHPDLSKVAVAVLTAQAAPSERDSVLSMGVDLYRIKPLDWDQTVELARELFDLCKGSNSLAATA